VYGKSDTEYRIFGFRESEIGIDGRKRGAIRYCLDGKRELAATNTAGKKKSKIEEIHVERTAKFSGAIV
jgi:hypothetical protein